MAELVSISHFALGPVGRTLRSPGVSPMYVAGVNIGALSSLQKGDVSAPSCRTQPNRLAPLWPWMRSVPAVGPLLLYGTTIFLPKTSEIRNKFVIFEFPQVSELQTDIFVNLVTPNPPISG